MGGLPAGPVDRSQHAIEAWENKADAIVRLLSQPGRAADGGAMLRVDELRRGIEELGPGVYDELGYYERWIASTANILIEKGVLTVDELGRAIEAAQAERDAAGRR